MKNKKGELLSVLQYGVASAWLCPLDKSLNTIARTYGERKDDIRVFDHVNTMSNRINKKQNRIKFML